MPRMLAIFLFAVVGFVLGAIMGYFLISTFSSNSHDVAVEAAMTGIFVFGPLGALIGAAIRLFAR